MLVRFAVFVLAWLAVVMPCAALSPNEEKVIGTWEAPGGFGPRCIYNRDHTQEVWFPGFDGGKWIMMSKGTWHLDGNDIVADSKFAYRASDPGETMRVWRGRTRVLEFRRDRLILDGSPKELVRVK